MTTLGKTLSEPVFLGQLRQLWTSVGMLLIALGITTPEWAVGLFGEAGTIAVFSIIGSVITLVQIFKSVNAPEKLYGARKTQSQWEGISRHAINALGIMIMMLGKNIPEWLGLATTPEGTEMLIQFIGSGITYWQFLRSAKSEEKQISTTEYASMRKAG